MHPILFKSSFAIFRIVAFLFIEAILVFAFWYYVNQRPVIIFAATVVGGAFGLYSFLHGVQSTRRSKAAEFIERWNSKEMSEERKLVRQITGDDDLLEKVKRKSRTQNFDEETKIMRAKVNGVLNFLEEMSIAIFEDMADERILYRYFHTICSTTYKNIRPYVRADQEYMDEDYYCEIESLYKRWSKRRTNLRGL